MCIQLGCPLTFDQLNRTCALSMVLLHNDKWRFSETHKRETEQNFYVILQFSPLCHHPCSIYHFAFVSQQSVSAVSLKEEDTCSFLLSFGVCLLDLVCTKKTWVLIDGLDHQKNTHHHHLPGLMSLAFWNPT